MGSKRKHSIVSRAAGFFDGPEFFMGVTGKGTSENDENIRRPVQKYQYVKG